MSLEVWPRIAPEQLDIKRTENLDRELAWIIEETMATCQELKHGLEDCYALLAPIDPGSTLVMSTPRNEKVKGTITRVGTRIVKGSLNLQLRMLPPQSLALSSVHPIHIELLETLHTNLTQSIDLLALTLSRPPTPQGLASSLSLLATALSSSAAILKGPPLAVPDPGWQSLSLPPQHFAPALGPNISFHVGLQECCIVLWLRVLEQVDAPQHFGMKLGLAFGTFRRLEHDEMDLVFKYSPGGTGDTDLRRGSARHTPEPPSDGSKTSTGLAPAAPAVGDDAEDVYVREKVRVESADPSLISLYSKLGFLSHRLGQARQNLAAVMGVELDE